MHKIQLMQNEIKLANNQTTAKNVSNVLKRKAIRSISNSKPILSCNIEYIEKSSLSIEAFKVIYLIHKSFQQRTFRQMFLEHVLIVNESI